MRSTVVPVGVIGALLAATVAGLVAGWPQTVVGSLVGLTVAVGGIGLVITARRVAGGHVHEEDRHHKGPDRARRRLLLGGAAGAATLTGGVLAAVAVRRVDEATAELRATGWAEGMLLVDASGEPIRAAEVDEGELLTVYPEGHIDAADSQAVLIREPSTRFAPELADEPGVREGFVAYSKLCTHMACPLGLYQQRTGTLLCPCHQALFDVLDRGEVLRGPAERPLPRLPLRVRADGLLEAGGDFSDTVGTGFWTRPS